MSAHAKSVNTSNHRQPEYVGLEYAAAFYGTSQKTIRRMIAEGTLPAYRVGKRQIRIRHSDLEKLARPIPAGAI